MWRQRAVPTAAWRAAVAPTRRQTLQRALLSTHTGEDAYPEAWIKLATKELKGKDPTEALLWKTAEGIPIKPLYTKKDLEVR